MDRKYLLFTTLNTHYTPVRKEDSSFDKVMRFVAGNPSKSFDQRLIDLGHAEADDEFIVVDPLVRGALHVPRVDDVFFRWRRCRADARRGRQRLRYAIHRNVRHSADGRERKAESGEV